MLIKLLATDGEEIYINTRNIETIKALPNMQVGIGLVSGEECLVLSSLARILLQVNTSEW